jgi:hypothetical protein
MGTFNVTPRVHFPHLPVRNVIEYISVPNVPDKPFNNVKLISLQGMSLVKSKGMRTD